ncbi:cobW-domain-containing protein, partial [Thelephora ganbajun]
RVPVTIISGFLGAGKSTLVKSVVLTERHGYRIAVIMNEFGDTAPGQTQKQTTKTINVFSDSQQSEEFLELANGCLCCGIKDSGVAAIENLIKRKGAFDYILLETTGLADPGRLRASIGEWGHMR